MSVSILFAELIIIGLQTLIWIILIASLQLNSHLNAILFKCLGLTSFSLIIIAACYTLGVICDRLADSVFSKWNERLKNSIIPNPDPNIGTMRFLVGKDDPNLNVYLEYTRSRMRIARSSALNIPLIMVSLILYLIIKLHYCAFHPMIYTTLIIGVGLSYFSVYTWKNLTVRHLDLIRTMFMEYQKNNNAPDAS